MEDFEKRLVELEKKVEDLELSKVDRFKELEIPVGVINFNPDGEPILPTRKKEGDCGYDAYALEEVTINPHSGTKIPLGIGLIIPEPFGVKAETRSGNHIAGLNVGSAWVDRGYRGQINCLIQNITDEPITIHKGDRPCSIELELTFKMKFMTPEEYCEHYALDYDEVMNTERGAAGFGSTGK